tara:strand:- start:139703 stop:139927 length:225 start_codon:yes stop_codon:yes gene_type:complete
MQTTASSKKSKVSFKREKGFRNLFFKVLPIVTHTIDSTAKVAKFLLYAQILTISSGCNTTSWVPKNEGEACGYF